jgi:uncharacterized protein YjbI with pentapeptide repeats
MMKYEIRNRFTGVVQFTAEIDCDENAPTSLKIGLSVRWAMKSRADLSSADLLRADLSGADLSRADLSDAYLSRADLSGADLLRADLSRADLSGADLSDAYLSGADLSRADLSDAYLSRADLSGADLSGANLSDANLSDAYLSDADLSGADLSDAKAVVDLGYPNSWRSVGWWNDGAPWVRVGCRTKSLTEARAYWAGKDDRREVMAALDYFEAIAAIRADEKSEVA